MNSDIWIIDFEELREKEGTYRGYLSDDEILRSEKFRMPSDRRNFIICRAILRLLLSEELECLPAEIKFDFNEYDRPKLPNKSIDFNVSHSQDFGLIGIARDSILGLDIEFKSKDIEVEQIASKFFSSKEIEILNKVPKEDRINTFYRCWTRKEAFIKAIGQGLTYPLDTFQVSLENDHYAELIQIETDLEEHLNWRMFSFCPSKGYIGAVAIRNPNIEIQLRKWDHERATR